MKIFEKLKAVAVVSSYLIAVKSGSGMTYFFLFLLDLKIPLCDLKWLFSNSLIKIGDSMMFNFFNYLMNILIIF